jgi:mRNA interferase RelE/StbE
MYLTKVVQSLRFRKIAKKLHAGNKAELDSQVKKICQNPDIGELKKGDLAGIRVYKFKIKTTQYLLSYTYNKDTLSLIDFGTHENFYKNLKQYLG